MSIFEAMAFDNTFKMFVVTRKLLTLLNKLYNRYNLNDFYNITNSTKFNEIMIDRDLI